MPRIPQEGLIPRADRLLIQAFPKVAKRLENTADDLARVELDAYLKLLPGAVERYQAVATPVNDLHESVETAIIQLVASFPKQTFESQPASAVDPAPLVDTRNTSLETGEIAEGDSDSEPPNGSDTSQQVESTTLPHNEIEASAGSGGESDSPQASPRNSRVRSGSRLQGKAASRRSQLATGKPANDRG